MLMHIVSLAFFLIAGIDLCVTIQLVASPSVIDSSTSMVSLECLDDESTNHDIVEISRIRILKQELQHWEVLAEMLDYSSDAISKPSVTATGFIGQVNETFLKVTWDVITNQTAGQYRCDIIGFKSNQDVIMLKSPIVVVVKHDVSAQEVLVIVSQLKEELHKDLQDQKKDFEIQLNTMTNTINSLKNQLNNVSQAQSQLGGEMHNLFNLLQSQFSDQIQSSMTNVSKQLLNQIEELNTTLAQLINGDTSPAVVNNDDMLWPQGRYALLMPKSGCPSLVTSDQQSTGYIKLHTESSVTPNEDHVSPSHHLQEPIFETDAEGKNFMFQRFCMKSQDLGQGTQWPAGSYCINRVGGQCPAGFLSGSIVYDEDDTEWSGSASNNHPDRIVSTGSQIYYCCRQDEPASQAVNLPSSRPFYLFRYGGTCQEVAGMQVQAEFLQFDTESSDNRDFYENAYHPDGQVNNVITQLCYYHK